MTQPRSVKLTVPKRDRQTLEFCDGSPAGLTAWLVELPTVDPVRRAHALYGAMLQLNRCATPFVERHTQLEVLRPEVHLACAAVSHRRRGQALMRTERERKEAALAQRLQYQTSLGYKMVVVDALRAGEPLRPSMPADSGTRVVVTAIHRTLTELAHTLLRSLQYYTPPPARLWEQMHQLYYLAEQKRVSGEHVVDPEHRIRPETDIGDAYERALLLAAARPNSLRHAALGSLFVALEDWTRHISIVPAAAADSPTMVVDLNGDRPPTRSGLHEHVDGEDLRQIDSWELVDRLGRFLDGETDLEGLDLQLLDDDHEALIRHGVDVWGGLPGRAHPRRPVTGRVELAIALEAAHFHAGGGRTLAQQLQSRLITDAGDEEEEIFDPFAGSSDVGGANILDDGPPRPRRPAHSETDLAEAHARHSIVTLELSDASTGGYGLVCSGEPPVGLNAGELMAIREPGEEDWALAQLRWCANGPTESRIGAALLSARVETGAARSLSARNSNRQWQPVIMLPAIEALGQAAAMLAPPGFCTSGQKIAFNQQGRESKLLIEARVQGNEAFEQFEVRVLGGEADQQDLGIEVNVMSEEDERAAMEAFGFTARGRD
ncbi:MAG TPA: hypothetical protein VLA56_17085 [Pseudomonadales bacterium]|nr:hypothetical protein [Pseudomonadales bacterium]